MRDAYDVSWVFRLSLIVIVVCFLILIGGYPIQAIPYAAHDDALFFRGLESIKRDEWLGSYDNRTLVKGPFLSMLGAFSASVGVQAKFLEAVLYGATAIAYAFCGRRFGISRFLVLTLVILLLCNPHIWSDPGRRYLREIIYASCAMMALLLTVSMIFTRGNRAAALHALGAGSFLGMMYLTREEDIWILSSIALVLVLGALQNTIRNGLDSIPSMLRSLMIRGLCMLFGVAVFVGPVLVSNHSNYGRAIVSEFRAQEFKAAVGALMRVGDIHPSGYIPVPQTSMQSILDTIPAAGSLQPHWPALAAGWSRHGESLIPDYSGEIAGGWFVWAFRDAVALAGHHKSAGKAQRFYTELAAEVNAACADGTLACRHRRDTLRPELPMERIPALFAASWSALLYTVSLSGPPITPPRSVGARDTLDSWSRRIGPVVVNASDGNKIAGWVAHRSSEPTITRSDESPDCILELVVSPDPDVVAHFEAQGLVGVRAVRFQVMANSIEAGCSILAVSAEGDRSIISLDGSVRGPLTLTKPFWGHLDVADQNDDMRFTPHPLEGARQAIVSLLVACAGLVAPILTIAATLGLVAYLFAFRNQRHSDRLVILTVGAAVLVLVRCAIIGYIDITSWRAINTGYLGPAYPFVIIYSVAGTAIFTNVLRQKIGRFRRETPVN